MGMIDSEDDMSKNSKAHERSSRFPTNVPVTGHCVGPRVSPVTEGPSLTDFLQEKPAEPE
jgi:hypothetical protein